ncbi:MAG: hypothetical protein BZY80_00585 [SAR202 cluster bacterium Io17-Chloro-G2]|nr:MAG: hypothetical protein BZY80_00585 [SAR202 cluster bacterium Io17-Chloro-G2]
MPRLYRIWLMVLLIGVASAAGCAAIAPSGTPVQPDTPAPTDTPEPPLDAEAVLQRAAGRVAELRTAAFLLDHRKGSTTLFPGVEMTRASGVVAIPDRYRLVVEARSAAPQAFIEITVVSVGDEVRMTDFFTGRWRVVPQSVLPVDFSQLGVTLAEIVHAVILLEPELVGTEAVAGVETHRVHGSIKSEGLGGLVPGAGKGFDVSVDLWVEMPEGLVHQVLITGQVLSTDLFDSERLLTLGDFDLPVAIELPE